jgi:hypothetical protein
MFHFVRCFGIQCSRGLVAGKIADQDEPGLLCDPFRRPVTRNRHEIHDFEMQGIKRPTARQAKGPRRGPWFRAHGAAQYPAAADPRPRSMSPTVIAPRSSPLFAAQKANGARVPSAHIVMPGYPLMRMMLLIGIRNACCPARNLRVLACPCNAWDVVQCEPPQSDDPIRQGQTGIG